MSEKIGKNKIVILRLLVGAVYFFLRYLWPLTAPVLLAALLTYGLIPVIDRIRERLPLPRGFFMLLALLLMVVIPLLLCWLLVQGGLSCLPACMKYLGTAQERLGVWIRGCCDGIESRFGICADQAEVLILERIGLVTEYFQVKILPGMLNHSLSYMKTALSVGAFLAVTGIAVLLLVKDYDRINQSLHSSENLRWISGMTEKVLHYLGTYVKAQLLILLAISSLCVLVLLAAGIPHFLGLGVLAGFLDMLPFIGTGIVLVPLAVWQLLNGWYGKAAACILLYGACALLRELLEPKLIGKRVGIYPIAILLSVYAGIRLFGISGILKGPLGLVLIHQGILELWKSRASEMSEKFQ